MRLMFSVLFEAAGASYAGFSDVIKHSVPVSGQQKFWNDRQLCLNIQHLEWVAGWF